MTLKNNDCTPDGNCAPDNGIASLLMVAALMITVILMVYLSMTSPSALEIQRQQDDYFRQIERELETPAGQRAWKRLHRKHGYPGAVVYPAGKEPYYINTAGQKCRFI
jgi:hypothetical protein